MQWPVTCPLAVGEHCFPLQHTRNRTDAADGDNPLCLRSTFALPPPLTHFAKPPELFAGWRRVMANRGLWDSSAETSRRLFLEAALQVAESGEMYQLKPQLSKMQPHDSQRLFDRFRLKIDDGYDSIAFDFQQRGRHQRRVGRPAAYSPATDVVRQLSQTKLLAPHPKSKCQHAPVRSEQGSNHVTSRCQRNRARIMGMGICPPWHMLLWLRQTNKEDCRSRS